jgi:hypothetical protein
MFDSKLSVRKQLEYNDVHEEAYRCWDVSGRLITLEANGNGVGIGHVSEESDEAGLTAAIERFASILNVDVPKASAGKAGPVATWEALMRISRGGKKQ